MNLRDHLWRRELSGCDPSTAASRDFDICVFTRRQAARRYGAVQKAISLSLPKPATALIFIT
jgi:hypothetical protein